MAWKRGCKSLILRHLILILTVLTVANVQTLQGQITGPTKTPARHEEISILPPELTGEIQKVSGEFRLKVANNDPIRTFQGQANISFGNAQEQVESVKANVVLAPMETAIILLYSLRTVGDSYTLVLTDNATGGVVFHKIAPVKVITDAALTEAPPKPINTIPIKSENSVNLKIKLRLAGGASETDPYLLAFEMSTTTQITNAVLHVKAKGLDESRPVNFNGKLNIEIKLPDELEVQKINYTVIGSKGEMLARNEADISQLMTADAVNIDEMKFDKPAYKAGETAKLTVKFVGGTPEGVRIEINVKDSTGKIIFRDLKKEKPQGDVPVQNFSILIPKDVKEALTIEIKVFEGDSNTILDSSIKDLTLLEN